MRYSYAVLIEKSANNYGAWAPDLPGCITTGPTVEETLANMREAIEFHLEGMREDRRPDSRTEHDCGSDRCGGVTAWSASLAMPRLVTPFVPKKRVVAAGKR